MITNNYFIKYKEAGESKMKIKKIFSKIGILSIILILTTGLVGVPVLAQDVEPQATATGTVTPNVVTNDGESELHFSWDIYDWEGTADYYTFQVNVRGQPGTPLYIQYSDNVGTDTFPPADISMDLQDINGTVGGLTVHVRQPDYTDTHDWTVPDTVAPGLYAAWVNLYLEGQTAAAAGAYIPFEVEQAEGCLTVRKESDTGAPQEGWRFDIYGPDDPGTFVATVYTESDGEYTLCDLTVGEYTVVETVEPNWTPVDPATGPPYQKTATVTYDTTVKVTFINQPAPGCILIHKYIDTDGQGDDDEGLDGVGWEFKVYKTSDLVNPVANVTTDGNGDALVCDLDIGDYRVVETLQSGWRCTDPGSGLFKSATVTSGITDNVAFGNQELGSLTIYKYEDEEPYDSHETEPLLSGWDFSVSGAPGTYTTGDTGPGYVTVTGLVPGTHTVTEELPLPPNWVCTDADRTKTVYVPSGSDNTVWFGNRYVEREVPTLGQWGIIILSIAFVALLAWFGVRKRRMA